MNLKFNIIFPLKVKNCVDDRTKKAVKIKSAVVTKVNDDGTVNV